MGTGVTLAPPGSPGRSRRQLFGSFLPLRSGAAAAVTHAQGWARGSTPSTASAFSSAPVQPGCHFGTEWETWLLAQISRLCPALLSAVPGKGAGGPGRAPGAVTSETVCPHNAPRPSSSPVRGMGLGSPRGAKGTFFSFSERVLTCFSLSSWIPVLSNRLSWSQTREPNSEKASPLTAPCLSWSGLCRGCSWGWSGDVLGTPGLQYGSTAKC